MKKLVKIEFFWDDLTKKKQDEIRKDLGMDEDDNGNWDVIPMGMMEVEFDEEEA